MKYESTTTLRRVRETGASLMRKLYDHLGKTKVDDDAPLPLLSILDISGFRDALSVLGVAMPDDRLARHAQAAFIERGQPIFERDRPGDTSVRDMVALLRDDDATEEAREAARENLHAIADSEHWRFIAAAAANRDVSLTAGVVARTATMANPESTDLATERAAQEQILRDMLAEE